MLHVTSSDNAYRCVRHLHFGGTATHDGIDKHSDCHDEQEIACVKQM